MSGRVAVVFGTRPEMIKLAPVIWALGHRAFTVHTGQHFDAVMSGQFLAEFRLGAPDHQLSVGAKTRGAQIGEATAAIETWLLQERPSVVVVQGDTNSGVAGALAANAADVPLVHLEAGLRSFDRAMPEEHNRVLIDALADRCLAPHESNADLLRREGVADARIRVTGSTLREVLESVMPAREQRDQMLASVGVERDRFVLATIHRAENADDPDKLEAILTQLDGVSMPVVVPLHPRTAASVRRFGLESLVDRLLVCQPLGYADFVGLAGDSALMISDSGGVQEEATIVKRPVVIVRNSTERPELLGTFAHLVDAGPDIGRAADQILSDLGAVHERLERMGYPYGEDAARRVIDAIDELDRNG